MSRLLVVILILGLTILIVSCDKGIEPVDGLSAFSGKITFNGAWPQEIKRTHLVVFREPIKSVNDFSASNLSFVLDSIPYGAKEFNYNSGEMQFNPLFSIKPGSHKYVVVAQSKTPELTLNRIDWTVVGVYSELGNPAKPKPLIINTGKTTTGVDITVNFQSLPPQPPM
ncbi:MAG: hypothetical protein FD143_2619 [Ignavibacteria bacterium]|nr:MAG: hypothetical protein FD143_2619 [Ignavibacteria bacterium]KAF0156900.1 MAG: hypothetical protein FD188_2861 [Ignavibacteria bacterium]